MNLHLSQYMLNAFRAGYILLIFGIPSHTALNV